MTSECCQEYIVQDSHTGDEICTACSRATRALLFSSLVPSAHDRLCLSPVEQELRDICANYCIPDNIFYQTVERIRKNPLARQRERRENAASCLQRVLAEHDAPRTLKELSAMFHIPECHIRQPQQQQQRGESSSSSSSNTSLTKPSDLARRVLYSFDIIHQPVVDKIGKEGDALFYGLLCSSTPQSALAVSIAMNFPFVPKQLVATNCHISKQTLLKHLRRLGGK